MATISTLCWVLHAFSLAEKCKVTETKHDEAAGNYTCETRCLLQTKQAHHRQRTRSSETKCVKVKVQNTAYNKVKMQINVY